MAVTTPDGYVNDECPDECNAEHEPPPERPYPHRRASPSHRFVRGGQASGPTWCCPTTGARYRYCFYCHDTNGHTWVADRHGLGQYSVAVDNEWCCDPEVHGFYACSECDSYYHVDDGPCCVFEPEDDDYYDDGEPRPGESVVRCVLCNAPNTFFDELKETFVCRCVADTLRSQKVPVLAVA